MKTLKLTLGYFFVSAIMALSLVGNSHATSEHEGGGGGSTSHGQGQLQGQLQGQYQNAGAYSNTETANNNANHNANVNNVQGSNGYSFSDSNSHSNSSTGASTSGSTAQSGNSGASVNIKNQGTDLSRGVGVAVAPAVYNSMITCMGGVSASGGFAGGAFSVGTSIESSDCNVRQDALLVKDDPEVYKAVACQSPRIKEAYRLAGRPCLTEPEALTKAQAKANSEARMKRLAEEYAKK